MCRDSFAAQSISKMIDNYFICFNSSYFLSNLSANFQIESGSNCYLFYFSFFFVFMTRNCRPRICCKPRVGERVLEEQWDCT